MNNSPPTSANNNAPVQLGHYQLRDCIGRGGMGLVYRARDTRLERDVAIKCLRTELFEAHYIERFKREALLLAKLNHPNIVQIYDFIEVPEQVALVMELVDGQNLQTYLREHIVPIAQRLQWLVQISEGLAVAHDAGIIHRDLKTENILINKRGQAKITDLGIAKSQDFNATLTDHVAGSYCSMSPEQAMGEAITFKSDLFSLGILAYQLLCGAHPFGDTNNKLQTMQRIITHPPTSPQQHNPDLPAEFIDLLGQLLSKDPDKRPDNTHWVAAQFSKLKELTWAEDLTSDDTQAIPVYTNTKASRTQDHPTFDTRFVAVAATPRVSLWQKLKSYIAANKIVVSSATVSFLIIAGVVAWQLQPKPPKYVAVIPPKLTAEGMQESQQELVKGAVYDAIQQSVIQLDGYYLIPSSEVSDVNGDNEAIRKATAADELITTEIFCKFETCNVTQSKLLPTENGRLIVNNTKNIDIVIDNYLTVAETIQHNISLIYQSDSHALQNQKINENEYIEFLKINHDYFLRGASRENLEKLKKLSKNIKNTPTIQSVYTDISLDIYYDSKEISILNELEEFIKEESHNKKNIHQLINNFYLHIAKEDFESAESTIKKISHINSDRSMRSELEGYLLIAKKNYSLAAETLRKIPTYRQTNNNLFLKAKAYWYSGNTTEATETLGKSLAISENHFKSRALLGLIKLYEGNVAEATISFAIAAKQKPSDPFSLGNLGVCYLLQKNYEKAATTLRDALKTAPTSPMMMLNLADAEYLNGNRSGAFAMYRAISDIQTTTNEDLRGKAQANAQLGNFSEALASLKALEKVDPDNVETTFTAALVHTLANNDSSALFSIENALNNGLNTVWFNLPWFDRMCKNDQFVLIMKKNNAAPRCGSHLQN